MSRTFRIARALFVRAYQEHRQRLFLPALTFLIVTGLVVILSVVGPSFMPTARAVQLSARYFLSSGSAPAGSVPIITSALLIYGPYLVGVFAALFASAFASTLLHAELQGGGFELTLSTPTTARQFIVAILLCTSAAVLGNWLVMTLILLGSGFAVALAAHLTFWGSIGPDHQAQFLAAIVLPLPLAMLAGAITLTLNMIDPKTAQAQFGMTNSPQTFVAMLPSAALLVLVTIFPRQSLGALTVVVLLVALLAVPASAAAAVRSLRPARYLRSF